MGSLISAFRLIRNSLLWAALLLPLSAEALLLGQTLKVAEVRCSSTVSTTNCDSSNYGGFVVNGGHRLATDFDAYATVNRNDILFAVPAGFSTPLAAHQNNFNCFIHGDSPTRPEVSTANQLDDAGLTYDGSFFGAPALSLCNYETNPVAPSLQTAMEFLAACSGSATEIWTFNLTEAATRSMGLGNPASLAVGTPARYSTLIQNTDVTFGNSNLVSYGLQMPAGLQLGSIAPNSAGMATAQGARCMAAGHLLTCTLTLPAGGMQSHNKTVGHGLPLIPQPAVVNARVAVNQCRLDPQRLHGQRQSVGLGHYHGPDRAQQYQFRTERKQPALPGCRCRIRFSIQPDQFGVGDVPRGPQH